MSSEKNGILFCLGCISVIPGIKNQLVNSMSFHPPEIKGYKYSKGGDSVMLFDCHRKRYVTLSEMKKSLVNIDPGRCLVQVKFTSLNGVDMFYYKNPEARLTIIYSHSNATDIGYLFGHLLDFSHKAQVNIISYEYNGYGQSKKKTSEESLYENIKVVVSHSINNLKIPPSSIILYGQSIGSAPTIHFASAYNSIKIGGIIIHSGIKSAVSVICGNTSSNSLPWYDAFRNLEKIQKVMCPVFVIHGTADNTIPLNHGEMLYNLAPVKYTPWYVNGANHCNIELNWRGELIAKVRQFIDYVSPTPKMASSKSYLNQDNISVSRISTLSSQGFENLCNDLDDDFDNFEETYGDHDYNRNHTEPDPTSTGRHTVNKSTLHNTREGSSHSPASFNTKSVSKYFAEEVAKIDRKIAHASIVQSQSSSHPFSKNHHQDHHDIVSPGFRGKFHPKSNVTYGVSIYEDSYK